MEIFRNSEWSVSPDGIEGIAAERGYFIEMDRIDRTTERMGISYYDWLVHIAEKERVSIEPFLEAFVAALRYYCSLTGATVDQVMLSRSLNFARNYLKVRGLV